MSPKLYVVGPIGNLTLVSVEPRQREWFAKWDYEIQDDSILARAWTFPGTSYGFIAKNGKLEEFGLEFSNVLIKAREVPERFIPLLDALDRKIFAAESALVDLNRKRYALIVEAAATGAPVRVGTKGRKNERANKRRADDSTGSTSDREPEGVGQASERRNAKRGRKPPPRGATAQRVVAHAHEVARRPPSRKRR